MTQQDPSPDSSSVDPFVEFVLRCQAAYTAWAAAEVFEQKSALSQAYRLLLEELWALLAGDLRQIARGWTHSNMAPDSESLALNMFGNIVFPLPRLQIDPQRNVRNLLLTIARRGLIDDYRRSHAGTPWRQGGYATSIDDRPDLIDPESSTIEDRAVQRIDSEALLKAVWDYWPENLNGIEYEIVKLRWQSDPPRSFGEIAERLGPGWEEAAVRQRHHRIMNKTRRYLRESGLIDDTSDP
jgi:DNA-directed RNA polymerase specialized sigma24 family protein